MISLSKDLVAEVFAPLCRDYGLRVVPVSQQEILVLSSAYAILLFIADPRDGGFTFCYIDIPKSGFGGMKSYALDLFLGTKRPAPDLQVDRAQDLSEDDLTRARLQRLSDHLRLKADDILRGNKDWLKEYPMEWGVDAVWPEVKTAIRAK